MLKIRNTVYFGQRFGWKLQILSHTLFFIPASMAVFERNAQLWAFNAVEFNVISNRCRGQNSKHKHAAWGINSSTKKFATSEETAYAMGLAKLIAHCYVLALHRLRFRLPRRRSMTSRTHHWRHSGNSVQLQASSRNHLRCRLWSEPILRSFMLRWQNLFTSCFNVHVNQLW